MTWLMMVAMLGSAQAQDCDVAALETKLEEASPVAVSKVYVELANCSAEAAKDVAPTVLTTQRMLSGPEGFAAVVKAIDVGAGEAARSWMGGLEPDQRSQAVVALGEACSISDSVSDFLVETQAQLEGDFWGQRWHRSLADCRKEGIQELLTDAVHNGLRPKSVYFSVLEVYARNLGTESVPTLTQLAQQATSDEDAIRVVQVFADAADVGEVGGMNAEAAAAARDALEGVVATLPPNAVTQARQTMAALGEPERADVFAQYRWPERYGDHGYDYGIAVTASVTCKNGKTQKWLHLGRLAEAGEQWPDQIRPFVEGRIAQEWGIAHAAKCKGTGELSVTVTEEPLADDATWTAWNERQQERFVREAAEVDKSGVIEHPLWLL